MKTLFAWVLVVTGTVCGSAQANIDIGCPVKQKIQPDGSIQFVDCKGFVTTQMGAAPPSLPKRAVMPSTEISLPRESSTALAYQKYIEAYYTYENNNLSYARKVFDWQYESSIVIFFVVILLVLTGLAFAGIQFGIAMRTNSSGAVRKKGGSSTDQETSAASTLELSPHGVRITSSVIGLLILVVSVGFFYLYLVYVYPIQNIAK